MEDEACDDIDNGSTRNRSQYKRYSDEAVSEYEKAIRGLKHRVVRTEAVCMLFPCYN